MFTGIIETTGTVRQVHAIGTNLRFEIFSDLSKDFSIDQSISHNGVCLTVESVSEDVHTVTAVDETLRKTDLSAWQPGTIVNIERCMQMNGRIDGHIVQGHVDTTAICTSITDRNGSWEYVFRIDPEFAPLIIEKGSISINGISLTLFNISSQSFTVAIIPYTYTHTNMQQLKVNDMVNIEFDMIGKYVNRINTLNLNL